MIVIVGNFVNELSISSSSQQKLFSASVILQIVVVSIAAKIILNKGRSWVAKLVRPYKRLSFCEKPNWAVSLYSSSLTCPVSRISSFSLSYLFSRIIACVKLSNISIKNIIHLSQILLSIFKKLEISRILSPFIQLLKKPCNSIEVGRVGQHLRIQQADHHTHNEQRLHLITQFY